MHKALCPEEIEHEDEAAAAKFRRKMTRENPHLVDAYFFKRIEVMMKAYFGPEGLDALWD